MRILISCASLVIGARALAPSGDYLAQLRTATASGEIVGTRLKALVVDPLEETAEAPVVPTLTGVAKEKAAEVKTEEAKLALLAEGVKILEGKAAEQAAREEAWLAASVANLKRQRVAEQKAAQLKAEQDALVAAEEAKRAQEALLAAEEAQRTLLERVRASEEKLAQLMKAAELEAEEEAVVAAEEATPALRSEAEAKAALTAATQASTVSFPPAFAVQELGGAIDLAAAAGVDSGAEVDAAMTALAAAERIAALAEDGQAMIRARKEAAAAAADYMQNQRKLAILGEWLTPDGEPLLVLKPDGEVDVPSSKGDGVAWKVLSEDGFSSKIEVKLRLSRFTSRGVYAGAQDHTVTGTVRRGSADDFDGTIAFGAEAEAEYAMRKA